MKNILKNKKILIAVIIITVIIVFGILLLFNQKNNKLKHIEDALENIFFYLPEEKYDNLNDIPDYCKISLVYGTKILDDDKYISNDDYNTEVKKNDKKVVKAYRKEKILKAVKTILGDKATINFDTDDEGIYQFAEENGCGYNNDNIDLLSYNELKEYVYSYNTGEKIDSNLFIKWDNPVIDGDTVTLTAKALLPVENENKSYTVYADGNMSLIVGQIDSNKKLETEIEKLYDTGSRKYVFTLKKVGDNYIWTNYEVIDYMSNDDEIIID